MPAALPMLQTGSLIRRPGASAGQTTWARYGPIVVVSVEVTGSFAWFTTPHLAALMPAALRPRIRAVGAAITESGAGSATVYMEPDGNVYGTDFDVASPGSIRGTIVYGLETASPSGPHTDVGVARDGGDLTLASGITSDAYWSALGPLVTVQVGVRRTAGLSGDMLLASGMPSRLSPAIRAYAPARLDGAVASGRGTLYVTAGGELRVTRIADSGQQFALGAVTYIATGV